MDVLYGTPHTWSDLVWDRLGDPAKLDPSLVYVCELVSPYNKIVRRYARLDMHLLTTFLNPPEQPRELPDAVAQEQAAKTGLSRPLQLSFRSLAEINEWLLKLEVEDPTFEGVVVRDRNNVRWKIKSRSYLGLHRIRGEGDNVFNPKNLLPFILSGEDAELLTYFPEVTEAYTNYKTQVDSSYAQLKEVWLRSKDIPDQKTFALSIIKETPFSSVLFNLRKQTPPSEQTEQALRKQWRLSEMQILKWLVARSRE
jgi:hypothetical protein